MQKKLSSRWNLEIIRVPIKREAVCMLDLRGHCAIDRSFIEAFTALLRKIIQSLGEGKKKKHGSAWLDPE
jgi:hypothetical protein